MTVSQSVFLVLVIPHLSAQAGLTRNDEVAYTKVINMNTFTSIVSVAHAAPLPCIAPADGTGSGCAVPISGFNTLFSNVLNVVVAFAAVILFIMLIVGGFKFITSGGNPKNVEAAKQTLTYAILGMVLVASAFFIIQVIQQFTGAPIEEFNVVGGP